MGLGRCSIRSGWLRWKRKEGEGRMTEMEGLACLELMYGVMVQVA